MPNPIFIATTTTEAQISIATEPALNAFTSLMALYWADEQSGFDEWVTQTRHKLSPEMAHTHRLVMAGLHFAIAPERSFPSFPDYLADLAATPAEALRDRLLDAYAHIRSRHMPHASQPEHADLLSDLDLFLEHLQNNFPATHIDIPIEIEAHHLLNNPHDLKAMAVQHLTALWNDYLAVEWQRVESVVAASVAAFSGMNLSRMSKEEAFHAVTGEATNEHWHTSLQRAETLVFVPSTHIGPYKQKLFGQNTLWIFFGARPPTGVLASTPDLTISEIMPGLNALADGVRLQILSLIARRGELCTADVMDAFDLTQSSAQRHLKQLEATGYLQVWRQDGAKWFSVNHNRIENTFRGVRGLVSK